jgi:hypothetical protein
MLSGRVFTASLKPAMPVEKLEYFLNSLTGTALVFAITHDMDTNEDTGELIEPHTHIYLEYDSPRKITTIANLLQVDENFIEIVKSKKAMLRYLTHKDDTHKYQYPDDKVLTNSDIPYSNHILGSSMSDREIAQYIKEGKGSELLGVVSASKLRTIQSFLSYDRNGKMLLQIQALNEQVTTMANTLDNVYSIANEFREGVKGSVAELKHGFEIIADSIRKATKPQQLRDHKPPYTPK